MMTLARFAIAFALLIGPTALMGATLPLVIKSSSFAPPGSASAWRFCTA
jgi:hypothetical protein